MGEIRKMGRVFPAGGLNRVVGDVERNKKKEKDNIPSTYLGSLLCCLLDSVEHKLANNECLI